MKIDDIELKCEEVQEILTRSPHALVRWGITSFFCIIILLFVGGCFFKYPDVIEAAITITTEHPPVWMVAKSSGKIQEVYAADQQKMSPGTIIAVLENTAVTQDVLVLEEWLRDFSILDSLVLRKPLPERLSLGSIQNAYTVFSKELTDYRNFLLLDLHRQKIEATQKELLEYRHYIEHLNLQLKLDAEQSKIADITHERERTLFEKGLIAQSDYEEAQQVYLNKLQGSEQLKTTLSMARIQEAQLQQEIIEIDMERNRDENSLCSALKSARNGLQTCIEEWKIFNLFIAPSAGVLSYNHIWQQNQYVNNGDKVFAIVDNDPGLIIGKIRLPVDGAGKIKEGQRVNIRVTGYPYMEYGFLTGKVVSISLLPDDENTYTVTVCLPQDLYTSYRKRLKFTGELTGVAEIITDERSIVTRLFSPFRYLSEKYLK